MFNLFKKKNKGQKEKEGVVNTKKAVMDYKVDKENVKVMPEKFLPKKGKSDSNYKVVIIIVSVLIVLVGIFAGLLTFSDSFNELLFGERQVNFNGDMLDSKDDDSEPVEDQDQEVKDNSDTDPEEDEERKEVFRKEVLDEEGRVVGAIVFEMRDELEYLDLKVVALLPEDNILTDEINNKFEIIGGVYSFNPGGVRLSGGDLKIEIFYKDDSLNGSDAGELKILNWEKEPEISLIPGVVNKSESNLKMEVGILPRGSMALAILKEEGTPFVPDEPGDIDPIGALPLAKDTDGDGLTDDEEGLYNLDTTKIDSDDNGVSDEDEVFKIYEMVLEEAPDLRLGVYNNEEEGYKIYYPSTWPVEEGEEGMVTFSSGSTGETVKIIIQANPENLTAKEWYLEQSGISNTINSAQIKTGLINGLDVAWSLDQYTAYAVREETVYLINYSAGLKEEASFKATFDGMVKSFNFPLDLITGYKYSNSDYGFSLELPLAWADYDAVAIEKDWGTELISTSLMFRLPSSEPELCAPYDKCAIFIIDIFDFITWNDVRLLDSAPLLVNVNNDYVFSYHRSDYYASDLEERVAEVGEVVETFVFD